MSKNLESKSIEQLLAEADELIQQIQSDAMEDMEDEVSTGHRRAKSLLTGLARQV